MIQFPKIFCGILYSIPGTVLSAILTKLVMEFFEEIQDKSLADCCTLLNSCKISDSEFTIIPQAIPRVSTSDWNFAAILENLVVEMG